jgi:hypothetical protein
VARPRKPKARTPPSLATEKPLLIYPIGQFDADPETLINFAAGVVPQPTKKSGFARLRALVTISIFALSDPITKRPLYQGRARAIQNLYLNLEAIRENSDPVLVAAARKNVARMLRPEEPFANCLRSFHRLSQDSPVEARQLFDDLAEFLDKNSP